MKRTLLLIGTIMLTFTLSSCFGDYTEGYKPLNKYIVNDDLSKYALFIKDITDTSECTNVEGDVFTLVEEDGNRYQYYGQKSGNCKVEVLYDTGMGLSDIQAGIRTKKFTVSDVLDVNWAFDIFVDQDADYEIDGEDFVQYFKKVGTKEIFYIDYGNTTNCSGNQFVTLYKTDDAEYDVLGIQSGSQCVSNYYVYHDYNTDDKVLGDMYTFEEALDNKFITTEDILNSKLEGDIYEVFKDTMFLAVSATVYFNTLEHTYNASNPYQLSSNELSEVLSNLASYRYQSDVTEDDLEGAIGYLTLTDNLGNEKMYEIHSTGLYFKDQEAYVDFYVNDTLSSLIESIK